MVTGMSGEASRSRRAHRLLWWYPKSWRDRYGEEFADHLEQEFADRSLDFGRSLNIAGKGMVARFGDFGFSNATVSSEGQSRAAVGTSLALTIFLIALMLNFWALAMDRWSSRKYHPIPVSATTGMLTVVTFLLVISLVALVLTVVVCVVRQFMRRQGRTIAVPSTLAAASGIFLLYAMRWIPIEFYRQMYLHPRPGIGWTHPGSVIAAAGETIWGNTMNWIFPWISSFDNPGHIYVINDIVPIAFLLFGVAIASLWRRVELPRFSARLSSVAVTLLGGLIGAFVVAYVAWLAFGGPSGSQSFVPEGSRTGTTYIVVLAVAVVLVVWTRWTMRKVGRTGLLSS
jgi:hypothetical protein